MGTERAILGLALAFLVVSAPLPAAARSDRLNDGRTSIFSWLDTEKPPLASMTLKFRHIWITEHDEAVRRIIVDKIERFMADRPLVKVKIEGLDQEIHRQQKLKAEMVAGNPPDIFCLWGGAELDPYVKAGRMLDLTSIVEELGLRYRFRDLSMWERGGKIYGLPLEGFCELFYYNKALFAAADAVPPRTVDDLVALCTVFRDRGVVPIALGNKERWPAAMIFQYCLNRAAGVGGLLRARNGETDWTGMEYRRGADAFASLVAAGAFDAAANTLGYERQGELFLSGKAAMVLTGSWEAERFGSSNLAPDIGCFAFPALAGGAGLQDDICGGYSFGIGFSAAISEAAKPMIRELIAAIFAEDVQTRYVYEAFRIPSMRYKADETKIANPVFAEVLRLFRTASTTWPAYDGLLRPDAAQAFNTAAQILVAGADPASALNGLQRQQDEAAGGRR